MAKSRTKAKPKPKAKAKAKAKPKAKAKAKAKPKRKAAPKRTRKTTPKAPQMIETTSAIARSVASPALISEDDPTFARGTLDGIPMPSLLWDIIDHVREVSGGDLVRACSAFRQLLDELDDTSLIRAVSEFRDAMRRAYDYNLWGAAYLIHGGCGDDAFWDFRAGVIALGRNVYESALADPDSLSEITDIEERTLFEGFQYVPTKVLEDRGLSIADPGHNAGPPKGENWSDEAELERRYPRLAARFN